jgi:hypothetical protein
MIADRRKEQQKSSKRGPKKPSTADRSIATGKANREAAAKARRGLAPTKKPNAMDVERETYRQSRKTAAAKTRTEKKASGGRLPPNRDAKPTNKGDRKPAAKGQQQPPPAIFGGRVPSKKQVEAAIKGMESIGQPVPPGHQVVLTFVPVVTAPPKPDPKGKKGKGPHHQQQQPQGGGGGGPKSQPNFNNNNPNNNNKTNNPRNRGRGYQK